MKHAPALTCLTNPTTNSYKRLVPGFEAPVNLAYSARNRSAAIRIPTYSPSPKAKRIEFRTPDAAANPYLAFSAMLLAGLDGIQNRMDPGDPLDKNLYELPPEELAEVASVPDSLRGAIEALQADHSFLLRGDVFNEDFIANWIDMKQKEYDALRLKASPVRIRDVLRRLIAIRRRHLSHPPAREDVRSSLSTRRCFNAEAGEFSTDYLRPHVSPVDFSRRCLAY